MSTIMRQLAYQVISCRQIEFADIARKKSGLVCAVHLPLVSLEAALREVGAIANGARVVLLT
jgi:hypothetical protein